MSLRLVTVAEPDVALVAAVAAVAVAALAAAVPVVTEAAAEESLNNRINKKRAAASRNKEFPWCGSLFVCGYSTCGLFT